jgi:hypothetical protein
MVTAKEIRKKEKGIESLIDSCQEELKSFKGTGNEEQVASVTYLLGEYQTMLSEYRQYHGL